MHSHENPCCGFFLQRAPHVCDPFVLFLTPFVAFLPLALLRFIEQDLKSVDRRTTPWLIVGGHRPIYIDSTWDQWPDGDLTVANQLQQALEELFLEYKVL